MIYAAIHRIRLFHNKRVFGIRSHVSGNAYYGVAGSVNRRPRFCGFAQREEEPCFQTRLTAGVQLSRLCLC
jgi:hypothetical protein